MEKWLLKPSFNAPRIAEGPHRVRSDKSSIEKPAANGKAATAPGSFFDDENVPRKRQNVGPPSWSSSSSSTHPSRAPTHKPPAAPSSIRKEEVPNLPRVEQALSSSFSDTVVDPAAITVENTTEGLNQFNNTVASAYLIAMAVVWPDSTTSHASSTVKFCTPSSTCTAWNCSCDRHIRVTQASKPVAGIVFTIKLEAELAAIAYFMDFTEKPSLNENKWAIVDACLSRPTPTVVYNLHLFCLVLLRNSPHSADNLQRFGAIFNRSLDRNVSGLLFDPRIASYLCSSETPDSDLELLALCRRYNIVVARSKIAGFDFFGGHDAHAGAKERVVSTLVSELNGLVQLYYVLMSELEKRKMLFLFFGIEIPLSVLLSKMENVGVQVNCTLMGEYANAVQDKIGTLTAEARSMTGNPHLNLSSPDQVSRLLYEDLQLPVADQHKTPYAAGKPRKHPSTSETELNRLLGKHPVVDVILKYRALTKVLSTYIEGMKGYLLQDSRVFSTSQHESHFTVPVEHYRLHASWNQTAVVTGRLSCSKPNLQNIPTDRVFGNVEVDLRSLFIPSSG
jgi:hypothetical protein